MKVRMKFSKAGPVRYVGHLDFMRYFTRTVARSGLPGVYTMGFSPHLLISFAAPLGVGEETLGDYADVELAYRDREAEGDEVYRLQNIGLDNENLPDAPSSEELCKRMNLVMAEGISVLDCRRVGQTKASKAMALVRSASWELLLKDDFLPSVSGEELNRTAEKWLSGPELMYHKKTKKSERDVNIRPLIYEMRAEEGKQDRIFMTEPFCSRKGYDRKRHLFIHCATGSTQNLKPGSALELFCAQCGYDYDPYGYQIVRTETFAEGGIPLGELGTRLL